MVENLERPLKYNLDKTTTTKNQLGSGGAHL
jgi:hypothetical protein